MNMWTRRAGAGAAALGLAGAVTAGTVLAQPRPSLDGGTATTTTAAGTAAAARPAGPAEARSDVATLQDRLRRVPRDYTAWAALGSAYVREARRTGDPTFYSRAEEAYARSLEVRPDDNAAALTGQANLAAARHDFATALELARRAQRVNPYSATTQGVLVDALVELGRYDDAATELQRMVDLKPDVASLTRVSYYRELTGDLDGARAALEQAGRFAFAPEDAAYVEQYLGELAFSAGDLRRARGHYEAGLSHTPAAPRLVAGLAAVKAAEGETDAALQDYRTVVQRLPEPGYLIAYAELLEASGQAEEAAAQYTVIDATARLFRAEGANPDLELALYTADHGRPRDALRIAEREWRARRSVHTEDAYAWALHVNGRHREALEHARAAARVSGANALFAYHRGMIERALGLDAEAEESLARALEVNPHFSPLLAPRARRALAELRGRS